MIAFEEYLKLKLNVSIVDMESSIIENGIDGDDAEEFLKEIFKYYNVDDSQFQFYDYFNAEFDLKYLFEKYFLNKTAKPKPIKNITFNDLKNVVNRGRW